MGVLTRSGRFCGSVHVDGEGTPVRNRGSGPGGRGSGWRGVPWWREVCYEVGGAGEQSEWAVTGEALTEEDDYGEIPWPGFASRCCGQSLAVGGVW
jgi:hypothetical protein